MPFRDEPPSPHRTYRSEFDRQAINAACRLLLSAVWLERRVAMQLMTFAERADARQAMGQPLQAVMAEATNEP